MTLMPIRSKGLLVTGVGRVEYGDIRVPEGCNTEVRIRARYSLMSLGTETSLANGHRMENSKFPYVPGYQGVGEIEWVGAAVEGYKVGDLVVYLGGQVEPKLNAVWGAHQELIVCGTENLIPVPAGMDLKIAAVAPLFAVGMHGVDLAAVGPTDLLVVLGHGLVGAGVAQAARARGARVLVSEPNPERRKLAELYGADWVVDPGERSVSEFLGERAGTDRADVVVESSGNAALIAEAIGLCRFGGKLVMQGWMPGEIGFSYMEAHRRQLTMFFPTGWGPAGMKEAALRLAASGTMTVGPYISHCARAADSAIQYEEALGTKRSEIVALVFQWNV